MRYAESKVKQILQKRINKYRKENTNGIFNITIEHLYDKYLKQDGRCSYCHYPMDLEGKDRGNLLSLDHWIAVSRGGLDINENIELCCVSCNSIKNGKLPHKYYEDNNLLYLKGGKQEIIKKEEELISIMELMRDELKFVKALNGRVERRNKKKGTNLTGSDLYTTYIRQNGQCTDCGALLTLDKNKPNTLSVVDSKHGNNVDLICSECVTHMVKNGFVRRRLKYQKHEWNRNQYKVHGFDFNLDKFVYEYNTGSSISENVSNKIKSNIKNILNDIFYEENTYKKISNKYDINSTVLSSFFTKNNIRRDYDTKKITIKNKNGIVGGLSDKGKIYFKVLLKSDKIKEEREKPLTSFIKDFKDKPVFIGDEETSNDSEYIIHGIDIRNIEYRYSIKGNIINMSGKLKEKIQNNIVFIIKKYYELNTVKDISEEIGVSRTILNAFMNYNNIINSEIKSLIMSKVGKNRKRPRTKYSKNFIFENIQFKYFQDYNKKATPINDDSRYNNLSNIFNNLPTILDFYFNKNMSFRFICNKFKISENILPRFFRYNFDSETGVAIIRDDNVDTTGLENIDLNLDEQKIVPKRKLVDSVDRKIEMVNEPKGYIKPEKKTSVLELLNKETERLNNQSEIPTKENITEDKVLLRDKVKQLIQDNKFSIIGLTTLIIGFVGGLLAN